MLRISAGASPNSRAMMFDGRIESPAKNVLRAVSPAHGPRHRRSEEHTSELQSLMRISYAVFCLKKKKKTTKRRETETQIKSTMKIYNAKTKHSRSYI